jgi:hypothetical protein
MPFLIALAAAVAFTAVAGRLGLAMVAAVVAASDVGAPLGRHLSPLYRVTGHAVARDLPSVE